MTKNNSKTIATKNTPFSVGSLATAPQVAIATRGSDGASVKIPTALASLANQMLVNFSRDSKGATELSKIETIVPANKRYAAWLALVDSNGVKPAVEGATPITFLGATGVASCACCAHTLGESSKAVLLENSFGVTFAVHANCVTRMGELHALLSSAE